MGCLRELLLVALGGALGSVARYVLTLLANLCALSGMWATLAANGLGSLLIGICFAWLKGDAYLLLAVGFCGGSTTFSTFSLQTVTLFQEGERSLALLYVLASLLLSIGCVVIGFYCANRCMK